MLPLIFLPAKIVMLFEEHVSPRELAAGVCLGMFFGFIPLNGPMALVLFVFFLVFSMNKLTTILTLPIFKLFYILGVARLADYVGGYLLIDAEYLAGFWTAVTHMPVLTFCDLNNTLVAGGLAISVALAIPVYFISKFIIIKLRKRFAHKINNWGFIKWVKKMPLVERMTNAIEKIRGQQL